MSKGDVFDFVESISSTKEDLISAGRPESEYNAFVVNRSLSYHPDSVLYVNEMNLWRDLPRRLQYDYLLHSLRRRQRRGRWSRPTDTERVAAVSERFQLSHKKAREMIRVLGDQFADRLVMEKKNRKDGQ